MPYKPETYGLTHLAISVADIKKTKLFYEQVFGMETMYQQPGFLQMTTPGCNDILVFEETKNIAIGTTGGIIHFGFRLRHPGLAVKLLEKIINAGGKIIDNGEFQTGSPYIFFHDPDGYLVEVWYEAESSQ